MCDCAEEQARRLALERKRRLAGYTSGADQSSSSGSPGVSWYSILGGTMLLALTALAVKTGADKDGWAKPIYIYFGLATEKPPCPLKIDDAKRKWPMEEKNT